MNLRCKIGGQTFKNPVWVASGTFGNGVEFNGLCDISAVGAVIPKTLTREAREGNKPPRIVETSSGLLNSIGLENPGIKEFILKSLPGVKKFKTSIIISIAGHDKEDFAKCAEMIDIVEGIKAIEVNLSCPNIKHRAGKNKLFAQDSKLTASIIRGVKKHTGLPIIAKLTPNVSDITKIAEAAEEAGADAVALVNTYPGMVIDIENKKPVLGDISGGLSGPAIKPLAVKAVYDTYGKIKIPVIGIGGIMTWEDAVEFILAGASAVEVGTANFVDPAASNRILAGLKKYMKKNGIKTLKQIIGKAHL